MAGGDIVVMSGPPQYFSPQILESYRNPKYLSLSRRLASGP